MEERYMRVEMTMLSPDTEQYAGKGQRATTSES